MERRQPDAVGLVADQRRDPLAHLLRRLVGEGDREHLIGLGMPVADEVGDPVGDDARLAGARAGENQQRPVEMQRRFALFGIQLVEEVHGGGDGQYTSGRVGTRRAFGTGARRLGARALGGVDGDCGTVSSTAQRRARRATSIRRRTHRRSGVSVRQTSIATRIDKTEATAPPRAASRAPPASRGRC